MTLGGGDKAARAVVYFAGMIFLFLGISIIADKFMSAIETITSQVTKPFWLNPRVLLVQLNPAIPDPRVTEIRH